MDQCGYLCVFRAVTAGELNVSPCLQDGSSLSPCTRWLVSPACGQSLQGRWVASKAAHQSAVLSVVGDQSGPLTDPPATSV